MSLIPLGVNVSGNSISFTIYCSIWLMLTTLIHPNLIELFRGVIERMTFECDDTGVVMFCSLNSSLVELYE